MSFNGQCHTRFKVVYKSQCHTMVKVKQQSRSYKGQLITTIKVIQGLRSQLDFKSDLALQIFSKKLANEDKRVTFCCI